MRLPKLLITLAGALMLAGCGIKGPLYLPEIPSPASAPPSVADHNKQDAPD